RSLNNEKPTRKLLISQSLPLSRRIQSTNSSLVIWDHDSCWERGNILTTWCS
ncbi:unnamed protein product, partial [Strongylus vulgaris]